MNFTVASFSPVRTFIEIGAAKSVASRASVRAATAPAESYELSLDDVRVIVAAEVARNYLALR